MAKESYRHINHLMPPKGWLNDPNGTCFFKGTYHIFFQYSPDWKERGWGHYTSKDLLNWKYEGMPIHPDTKRDLSGAYSGCCFTDDGKMEIFYTGNVKKPGDFDYINEGREHNVIYIESNDGVNFSQKKVLMENKDYPSDMSCHVRDPKVYKKNGKYYMLLGARTKDSKAALLSYVSDDKMHWELNKKYIPLSDMGYMLECPDYFEIDNKYVLSLCPQGPKNQEFRLQNMYHSGYFLFDEDVFSLADEKIDETVMMDNLKEWDYGFDFYAPQVFKTEDGRHIIVGWAGVPDAPYHNEKARNEGFENSLTLLRNIKTVGDKLYTYPIKEYEKLREESVDCKKEGGLVDSYSFDCEITFEDNTKNAKVSLNDDLILSFEDGVFCAKFNNESGAGRSARKMKLNELKHLRLFMDKSILEVYVNLGENVMTMRYYPESKDGINVKVSDALNTKIWKVRKSICAN
ncbi:beta-fructofuranosidase [Acetitomaculum ruminis DSM 5522]|uniref:beta-fructofuranosidase n=1 Tax=Acetitomaculum ruminis DSM 5522 TaxID=1120918 RepID=A0A1I0YWR9_9FIRM|nr:glycoside hydrolase family 32 protein [Acetitomaculum ruminis]SFB16523.1 beta-fructofuranosidase [Acetitomaculum ruminis DSM 5522]